jgi:hypothetical protein
MIKGRQLAASSWLQSSGWANEKVLNGAHHIHHSFADFTTTCCTTTIVNEKIGFPVSPFILCPLPQLSYI